jgi:predicted nucleic acid-binding Zn ribbon protein
MNPEEDIKEFECQECGTPMERDKTYCSDDCFKASQL